MAIPNSKTLIRPILEHLADGRERDNRELLEAMARHFDVTPEERAQLLPSGRQPVFVNRVAWAKAHLKAAGALRSPRRGVYAITDRGVELLRSTRGPIGRFELMRYEEYRSFQDGRGVNEAPPETKSASARDELTPEEHIDFGYRQLRAQLVTDILEQIRSCPPVFFEQMVLDLLVAMGYGGSREDASHVGRGGDGGIDGIIKEDRLGLDAIYVQAKRWEGSVGRPEIQKFAGALQGVRARKGIFITSSTFTAEAERYAGNIDSRIVLIDGNELAELMIDHGVGVSPVQTYEIKRIDSDYFSMDV